MSGRRGNHVRQKPKCRLDPRRERRLANPAEPETRHGDPELRGRDIAVGIRHSAPHRHGPSTAFGDELIDARSADHHDRELCRHEEPVCEHQRKDRAESDDEVNREWFHKRTSGPIYTTSFFDSLKCREWGFALSACSGRPELVDV